MCDVIRSNWIFCPQMPPRDIPKMSQIAVVVVGVVVVVVVSVVVEVEVEVVAKEKLVSSSPHRFV